MQNRFDRQERIIGWQQEKIKNARIIDIIERPKNGWPTKEQIISKVIELEEIADDSHTLTPKQYIQYLRYGISIDIFKAFNLKMKIQKL